MRLVFTTVLCAALMSFMPFSVAAPHIVVEVATGKVMSREQEFDRWYPASLTKLMTAYTVFQEVKAGTISLKSPVKVSNNALSQPPSKMGYPVGTIMTVDTALRILMVKSANDIAVALAESAAGSEQAFIAKMNNQARRLGMSDSNFVNPHGLHDPRQYTSARDLAVLTLAIKKQFPAYAGYFKIPALRSGKRVLRNHNPLLQRFAGTNGMKTGYICESGLNLVASAKRGGRELVAVVLGGPTGQERNVRAAMLLTDSFKKPSLFTVEKLDLLRRPITAKRSPENMRPTVCTKKKPAAKEAAKKTNAVFALSEPSLDDLEDKYLDPVGNNTSVERIVLNNATGPDPFGLISGTPSDNVSAFAETAQSSPTWPIVPGTKGAKVPVPTPRPKP